MQNIDIEISFEPQHLIEVQRVVKGIPGEPGEPGPPGEVSTAQMEAYAGEAVATVSEFLATPDILAPAGTTQAIDWDNGTSQILDLGNATDDVTVTFANMTANVSYVLKIKQGATARAITWPVGVVADPELPEANGKGLYTLYLDAEGEIRIFGSVDV